MANGNDYSNGNTRLILYGIFALALGSSLVVYIFGKSDPIPLIVMIFGFAGLAAGWVQTSARVTEAVEQGKVVEAKVDDNRKQMDGVLSMARQGAADAATKDEMVAQRDREAASLAASDTTTTTNTTTTSAATPAAPFTVYAPPLPVENTPVVKPGEGDTAASSSAIITTTPAAELTITPIADPKLPPENGGGKK